MLRMDFFAFSLWHLKMCLDFSRYIYIFWFLDASGINQKFYIKHIKHISLIYLLYLTFYYFRNIVQATNIIKPHIPTTKLQQVFASSIVFNNTIYFIYFVQYLFQHNAQYVIDALNPTPAALATF